jgi:hypothetical protein
MRQERVRLDSKGHTTAKNALLRPSDHRRAILRHDPDGGALARGTIGVKKTWYSRKSE